MRQTEKICYLVQFLSSFRGDHIWKLDGSVPLIEINAFFIKKADHNRICKELKHFHIFWIYFFKIFKYFSRDFEDFSVFLFRILLFCDGVGVQSFKNILRICFFLQAHHLGLEDGLNLLFGAANDCFFVNLARAISLLNLFSSVLHLILRTHI